MFVSTKKARWLFAAAGLVSGLALVYASNPVQDEPRMVDLNVVAVDNHGEAVTDLTRDDFRIVDNGKPETLAFFHHRNTALGAAHTLAPNEVSNRGGANVPRATLILFDLLNEKFGTRGSAANRLEHDLQNLESADYVYLYCLTLDGRLYPIHPLPGPETVAAPAGAPPWTRQIKVLLDQALRSVTQVRPIDDLDPTYRIQLTFNALGAIAAELSRVPGRKAVVWLTDGIPIELGPARSDTGDFVDFTPFVRQMCDAYDRSGVSIYPVRQVMLGSADSMGGPGTTGMGSIDTLSQFAELTGGRPDAGKDIGPAVRQAILDTRTSYQIGYVPPPSNWNDKYHKLRITCTRKGVRIQAKTGYYAWAEAAGARFEQAMAVASHTAFDAAEIGLRATLTRDPKDARILHLEAHIDAHDLVLVHQGDVYSGELRLQTVGFADGFDPSSGPVVPMELHLTAAQRDQALQQGIPYAQNLTLANEIHNVRLIVYDRGSTAIGSVTVLVPAPAAR